MVVSRPIDHPSVHSAGRRVISTVGDRRRLVTALVTSAVAARCCKQHYNRPTARTAVTVWANVPEGSAHISGDTRYFSSNTAQRGSTETYAKNSQFDRSACDGHIDRHTTTANTRASVASRAKKGHVVVRLDVGGDSGGRHSDSDLLLAELHQVPRGRQKPMRKILSSIDRRVTDT